MVLFLASCFPNIYLSEPGSAIDVSATTPTLPSLDAVGFLSVWSSESSLTAYLVRSWVNSVTSHFKFHLLYRCTLPYSVRYHMRRAYARCDENCSGGPRNYHHPWNGKRRICIRRSIPKCTCFDSCTWPDFAGPTRVCRIPLSLVSDLKINPSR